MQRGRVAALSAEWGGTGRVLTDQDIIAQLGWHPDHAVPPCPPITPPPKPTAFTPRTPPCTTRRAQIFREAKTRLIAAAIAPATNQEAPPPTDADYPVLIIGVCRKSGTCYPSDTVSGAAPDPLTYQVLWNAWTSGFHLMWLRKNDPFKHAIIEAFNRKWLQTAQ